jgi:hypothetical protein
MASSSLHFRRGVFLGTFATVILLVHGLGFWRFVSGPDALIIGPEHLRYGTTGKLIGLLLYLGTFVPSAVLTAAMAVWRSGLATGRVVRGWDLASVAIWFMLMHGVSAALSGWVVTLLAALFGIDTMAALLFLVFVPVIAPLNTLIFLLCVLSAERSAEA